MANIGLLIAGGSGNRMHQDIPKQFITVHERPVIVYTLEAFQNHPEIDAIAVVCIEGWEQVLWAYAKQFNITKLKYARKHVSGLLPYFLYSREIYRFGQQQFLNANFVWNQDEVSQNSRYAKRFYYSR